MSNNIRNALVVLVLAGFSSQVHAGGHNCSGQNMRQHSPPAPPKKAKAFAGHVWYQRVQQAPAYDISRPQVMSGTRVTFFVPFLRHEKGYVFFNYKGTTIRCEITDWQPECVTAQMPRLGLDGPKNVTVRVVLPDGRVAKEIPVLYVPQPTVIVHTDTIPQPLPPTEVQAPAAYAAPASVGSVLLGSAE